MKRAISTIEKPENVLRRWRLGIATENRMMITPARKTYLGIRDVPGDGLAIRQQWPLFAVEIWLQHVS